MSFIAAFIDASTTPEQADVLKRAFITLTEASSEVHVTRTEALLEANTLGSAHDYVLAVRNILQDEALHILKVAGITPNEETAPDLEVWINIIDTLLRVPNLDQPEEVLNILENDELESTEKLLALCTLVTTVNTSSYLYQIEDVSTKPLDTLVDIVRAKLNGTVEIKKEDIVGTRIRKVKPLILPLFEKDSDGVIDSPALDHIESATPGYSINSALHLYYNELHERTTEMLILEVFTLLLGSSVSDVDTSLDIVLRQLLDDKDIVTSIGWINKLTDTLR